MGLLVSCQGIPRVIPVPLVGGQIALSVVVPRKLSLQLKGNTPTSVSSSTLRSR